MVEYQIAFSRNTFRVLVQYSGDILPTGFTNIGTFRHEDITDLLGPEVNHVIFHHVRDALYHQGVQSMQAMTIRFLHLGDMTPPTGFIFLTDPDGAYYIDPDGAYLMESI